MTTLFLISATAILLSSTSPTTKSPLLFAMADGGGDDGAAAADDQYYADDQAADDQAANNRASYDDAYWSANAANPYASDGSIQYWTDFAIFPKRCVHWNGIDQIKFDMYEKSYKHCSDTAMGTYLTPVSTFVNAYLNQLVSNAGENGYEDYEVPEVAAGYAQCGQGPQVNGVQYYLQVGCSDTNPLALAVNIYEDDQCTTSSSDINGYDDSNIEIDITLPFQKCTPCVIWSDKNDDEIDDQYYVNKQTNAPLCSNVWAYKEECNGKCQKKTNYSVREGWNKADKVLLTILSFFGEFVRACALLF